MKIARTFVFWAALISLAAIPHGVCAALKVAGVATYEVFSSQGKQLVKVDESFDAIFDRGNWLITTRLLKLTPPSNFDQVFCPPYQEAGSDGEDCFYLKSMRVGGTNKLVGWVEPGAIPTRDQSPTIALLWLAYCSGSYLTDQSNSLRPVWIGGLDNRNRQEKCAMAVQFERSATSPQFLEKLFYLCDGRANPCRPKEEEGNLLPPPWSGGYTQAVLQVSKFIDGSTIKGIPEKFEFNVFTHKLLSLPFESRAGPEDGAKIQLRLVSASTAIVTNTISDVQVSSWLPAIPDGLKIGVMDYRFTTIVTNTDAVNYPAVGAWRAKTDHQVRTSVRYFATHRSWREILFGPRKETSVALRSLVAVAVGLLLVGACVYFWKISRK